MSNDKLYKFIMELLQDHKHADDEVASKIEAFVKENKLVADGLRGEVANWKIQRFASQEEYERYQKTGAITIRSPEENAELFGTGLSATQVNPQGLPGEGNLLLNEGITEMLTLCCTTGATKWDASNAYIGVGDSSTAEVATQTGLSASTNKLYKAMDSTYPQVSNQTVTFQATFASGDANWAWQEFTVSNTSGGDTGKNWNRKVSSQGTKQSGQVWTVTLTITFS